MARHYCRIRNGRKNIRNCETIVISFPHVIQKNNKVRHKLDNAIFDGALNV
jgi:hypothetical protein